MYLFEPYIKDFIFSHHSLSLEGIGILSILSDKGERQFNFIADTKAPLSAELIDYVAEQEHKNKSIVRSDIESFFKEKRELINIGSPWYIEGIGSIQKTKKGYEFIQETMAASISSNKKKIYTEPETAVKPKPQAFTKNRQKRSLAFISILIILAAFGGGIYYLLYWNNSRSIVKGSIADSVISLDSISTNQDTAAMQTDSSQNYALSSNPHKTDSIQNNDSITVKYVFERTVNPLRAYTRYRQLKNYGLAVHIDSLKTDSFLLYKLYVIKKSLPADTLRIKDSVSIYFGRKAIIQPYP